ncbi:MAG: aldo/keto reductase [Gemmatimonadetes bacterium]|nr:aldo/keto reductase [Gemmatimonadota bacterium]
MTPAWTPPSSGLIHGCWQLASGHGSAWDRSTAFAALDRAAEKAGPLVLDCADIYTGVERLLGDWMAARPAHAGKVSVHTKFVPDLESLPVLDRAYVRRVVERSRDRLRVETLDLVQLHWWDFGVPGWVRAAEWLAELREEGVVRHVGVTNFGSRALCTLLDEGIPVVANQVQLSLLDRRPLRRLAGVCRERGVSLLCYGTLAGGLLTDGPTPGDNRSLRKYRLIVDEVGGPQALERARAELAAVAARAGVSMAEAAAGYVLARPAVGAVIVGLSRRGPDLDVARVRLRPAEVARLEAAVPDTVAGGVYEVERDRTGPHGRIMQYDLNRGVRGA